jgi:hypothetical protein
MKTFGEFINEDDGMVVDLPDEGEYGVRWFEINKKEQRILKEKTFPNRQKLDNFVKKLEQKENFAGFYSWLSPSRD